MKLKNKIAALLYSLFVLLSVNGFSCSFDGRDNKSASYSAEQISETIILQGEGIVQPVFRINEAPVNSFRFPFSFFKLNSAAAPASLRFSCLSFKDADQLTARTATVSRHIVFRVLLV